MTSVWPNCCVGMPVIATGFSGSWSFRVRTGLVAVRECRYRRTGPETTESAHRSLSLLVDRSVREQVVAS